MERLIGRYIFDQEITEGKMIFITGPRQIGKTTFALDWLNSLGYKENYFNWDDPSVMVSYKRNPLVFKNLLDEKYDNKPVPVVFDEIHKHREWRNILKGLFDTSRDKMKLLVTGSARFNFFRMSGDSLIGRYFSFQMLPLGLPELTGDFSHVIKSDTAFLKGDKLLSVARKVGVKNVNSLEHLIKYGGFPEPVVKSSERFHRVWQRDYKSLLTKEDVRDLSRIADIKGMETLVEILPTKVGSGLSITSLSQDLARNYDSIQNWLKVLEGLYLIFTIQPWHKSITRGIKKEKKMYFLDWSFIQDDGSRFENLIAVALMRMVARFNETGIGEFELRYIRDREKREVDFVIVKDNKPIALFEAKLRDTAISKSGRYFNKLLNIPIYQIIQKAEKAEELPGKCYIIPASNFLMLTG